MNKVIDLTGMRFGSFTVLRRGARREGSTNAFWDVRCDCGTNKTIIGNCLTKGKSKSCGKNECHARAQPASDRFKKYTIPEPNTGCLLWTGSVDQHGYGGLRVSGKIKRATHLALELSGRPLPHGMRALHSCDNPYCVNADHLFAGTQKDNVADMMVKNRHDHSGLVNGRKVRLPEQKSAAFALYRTGKGLTEISKEIDAGLGAIQSWIIQWGHKTSPQWLRQVCPSGHPYSEENTYIGPKHGDRQCRECKRIWDRENRRRKRLNQNAGTMNTSCR